MSNQTNTPWNDARVDTLKKMWLAGSSAREIAEAIAAPTITRAAVIGKAHRLGLPRREEPKALNHSKGIMRPTVNFSRNQKSQKVASEVTELPHEDVPTAKIITLRGPNECAWPVGGARFCCAEIAEGSYCRAHADRARGPKVGKTMPPEWGRDAGNPERWFG